MTGTRAIRLSLARSAMWTVPDPALKSLYTEVAPGVYESNRWRAHWGMFEAETGKNFAWFCDRLGEVVDDRFSLASTDAPTARAAFGLP